jgi:glycosyltransferase involved in cell wall biosynthesis
MTALSLSVIVIFHDMHREAPRTLLSLSAGYQRGASAADYEIIAIDNGSSARLDPAMVEGFGPNVRHVFHATESVSPVEALNLGARLARGTHLAFVVDGARMASPGLIRATLNALRTEPMPFVCALSWHLGPDVQNRSILRGYDQQVEDDLLHGIDWPHDGYRLFEIATLAQSSAPGFLGGFPRECSWLSLSRTGWERLNGYDPAFISPGGGLVNHDIVGRAADDGRFGFIVLLGEGVFHQVHGGVATNVRPEDHPIGQFKAEFLALRGVEYRPPGIENVMYYGPMSRLAQRFLA